MLKRISRVHPATLISCLALFVALSGASYAAVKLPKNSVGSTQIKKNAVTGKKVKDRSLTGADIKLSTLGAVPKATSADAATNATSADSAKSLAGGVTVKRIYSLQPSDAPETEIYNDGSVKLTQTCAAGTMAVTATGLVPNGLIHWIVPTNGEEEQDTFGVGDTASIFSSANGDSSIGQIVYVNPTSTVTISFTGEEDSGILGATGTVCLFTGTATKG